MSGKEGRRDGPAGSRVKAAPAHPAPSEGRRGGDKPNTFWPHLQRREGNGLSLELANTVFVSGRERGKEKEEEEVVSRSRSFPAQSVGRPVGL